MKAYEEAGLGPEEIDLAEVGNATLRAGYSANADIIITKKEDILLIPERLITFENDSAFVEIPDSLGGADRVAIKTGLSDGMNIEVISGLSDGDLLVVTPLDAVTDGMIVRPAETDGTGGGA